MYILYFLLSHAVAFPEQSDIYLEVTGELNTNSNNVFFAPHENEHVSNEYVAQQIAEHGGKFLVLRQHGNRLISFDINKEKVSIDPNRMFTDLGIKSSIKKKNPKLNINSETFRSAVKRAKSLGQFIISQLGGLNQSNTWVAIHNNTQGYRGDKKQGIGDVSINSYQHKLDNGANYLINVTQLTGDEDDLFFVTQQGDFNAMQANQWNAVLQNPLVTSDIEEDDGSLSVYAQMNNIRYINIEAERRTDNIGNNHLETQKQMIDFTFNLISTK